MTVQRYLKLVRGVLDAVEKDLLDAEGNFKVQPDLKDDAEFIKDVEAAYVANGGVLQPNVAKAIEGAVAVLQILG